MSHVKQWLVVKQPTHVDELRLRQARQLKRLKKWARLKALKNRSKDIKNNLRDDILKLEGYIDKIDNKVEKSSDRIKNTQASIDLMVENTLAEMNQLNKDVNSSLREIESLNRET